MRPTPGRAAAAAVAVALVGGAGCSRPGTRPSAEASSGAAARCSVERPTRISIATGNVTGVYYVLGRALAEEITAQSNGRLKATAAETGASVQNVQQVVAGTHQVAFVLFDTASDAVNGKNSFEEKQPVAALARIYDNYTHVIVRTDAGIKSVAGMRGKRISTGSPKSGTEVIARRLLISAKVDPDSGIKPQRLDLAKSVDGMKNGSLDGLFWSGGLPTEAMTDLITTMGSKVKFLDPTPLLPAMQSFNATAYRKGTILADIYRTGTDIPTIVVPNVLLVRNDFDEAIACFVTRTLFEKRDQLIKANGAASGLSVGRARDTAPVPLNPGAVRALDDLSTSPAGVPGGGPSKRT